MNQNGTWTDDDIIVRKYSVWADSNIAALSSKKKLSSSHHPESDALVARLFSFAKGLECNRSRDKVERLKILLVVNTCGWRQICRSSLQKFDDFAIDLLEAGSGEGGLMLASREKLDCILFDHQLPDMNYAQFLDGLTELFGTSLPPILNLVEPRQTNQAIGAINHGLSDYLVKDGDGHFSKLLPAVIQRMMNRRRIDQEKQQFETVYRALVEHIPAITYVASIRNRNHLLYVSPQLEQLGYSSESWLNQPELRFRCIHNEDRSSVEQAFAYGFESREKVCCEYRLTTRSGELRWVHDEVRVVKDQYGNAMFFQGIILDITNMKAMQSELQVHRYFLDQRVQTHTEQLEKRIAILESCNSELCNQLEKEHKTCNELRKIKIRQDSMLRAIDDAEAMIDALVY